MTNSDLVRIAHRWIHKAAETGNAHAALEGYLRDVERHDAEYRPPMPEGRRKAISITMTGRTLSAEHRQAISRSRRSA